MSHRTLSPLLADYAVGALAEDRHRQVEEHLASCSTCREWLETYSLLDGALRVGRDLEHPESAELAGWAVLEGELPETASRHLAACPDCRGDLEILRQALRAARREAADERVPAPQGRRGRAAGLTWAAAAAAVILAVAAWLLLAPRSEPELDYVLTGRTLTGEQTFTAATIHASQTEIGAGSRIVFSAERTVDFGDGFEVAPGATLEVETATTHNSLRDPSRNPQRPTTGRD